MLKLLGFLFLRLLLFQLLNRGGLEKIIFLYLCPVHFFYSSDRIVIRRERLGIFHRKTVLSKQGLSKRP